MNILLRRLGEHRGSPRLYLDTVALASAGFAPGTRLTVDLKADESRLTIRADTLGKRRVSRKLRAGQAVPVIDINSQAELAPFSGAGVVRIVITVGAVHVLLPASVAKALARTARLASKLALAQPLTTAGIAFGAGIASRALHDGLAQAGVSCQLVLATEVCEDYIGLAAANSPIVTSNTVMAGCPMQELAQDAWALRQAPCVDILEAGIPCSGASKAGVSRRKLTKMEDHPQVGHLVGALIQLIAALQPAIVVLENVPSYALTASAAILRGWLRDAGYATTEAVLDASDFGSLEQRVRWFLVAYPPQLDLNLAGLVNSAKTAAGQSDQQTGSPTLADFLEDIDALDERFRRVNYLKAKEARDAEHGSNFAMQWLTPESTRVPTLRKGYHKGGSTDPRLVLTAVHPIDHQRSRLLTALEHSRIKGIDPALITGVSETTAHQVCGQAVDVRPVQAIGRWLGQALKASQALDQERMGEPHKASNKARCTAQAVG